MQNTLWLPNDLCIAHSVTILQGSDHTEKSHCFSLRKFLIEQNENKEQDHGRYDEFRDI